MQRCVAAADQARAADPAALLQRLAEGQQALQHDVHRVIELVEAHLSGRAGGADAALIHAIHGAFDEREFSSAELLQRGAWSDEAGRLLAALTLDLTKRHIGNRLAQLRGLPTASGLVVVQTSTNREGAVWRVVAFRDSQVAANPAAAGR